MHWLVYAKRHDTDFDVSFFLLAIVHGKPCLFLFQSIGIFNHFYSF
jgi:hypothetical protein